MHTSPNNALTGLEKQLGYLLYRPYKRLIFLPILIFSTAVIGALNEQELASLAHDRIASMLARG